MAGKTEAISAAANDHDEYAEIGGACRAPDTPSWHTRTLQSFGIHAEIDATAVRELHRAPGQQQAQRSAHECDKDRFEQDHDEHFRLVQSHRHQHTEFFRSFENGHQHGVDDAEQQGEQDDTDDDEHVLVEGLDDEPQLGREFLPALHVIGREVLPLVGHRIYLLVIG